MEEVEGELQVVGAKACLVVPSSLGLQPALNPRESASERPSEAARPVYTTNLYSEAGQRTFHSSLSGARQPMFHSLATEEQAKLTL